MNWLKRFSEPIGDATKIATFATLCFYTGAKYSLPLIDATIGDYLPAVETRFKVSEPVTLRAIVTNTGEERSFFQVGMTFFEEGTAREVVNQSQIVCLASGQQTMVEFRPVVETTGRYWVQFGIWKDCRTLLDRRPSPSRHLVTIE